MKLFNTGTFGTFSGDAVQPDHNLGKWLIEREPMLFQSSREFARGAGGPITQFVLDHLEAHIPSGEAAMLRIDTRSHMLMPGWFPCIPGWHCDFKRSDGGKQLSRDDDSGVKHYMFLSGGPATEFLENRGLGLDIDDITWGAVDRLVNSFGDELQTFKCPTGSLVHFDANELHRGTAWSGEPGHWRYFFRATTFPNSREERGVFANKIRSQVQIYCDAHAGW